MSSNNQISVRRNECGRSSLSERMVACTSLGSAATRSQGRILAGLDDCDATIYPTTTIIHPCIFLCVSLLSYLPSLLAFPVASRFPVLGSDPPSWVHRTIPESGRYSMPCVLEGSPDDAVHSRHQIQCLPEAESTGSCRCEQLQAQVFPTLLLT